MRVSVVCAPANIRSMTISISSARKSVRKPKRPRLMPTKGMLSPTRLRATLSMVPSPPITMAKSTFLPISSRLAVLKPVSSACCAVLCSSQTSIFLARKWRAKSAKSVCICCNAAAFIYLPIMPIEEKAVEVVCTVVCTIVLMVELNHRCVNLRSKSSYSVSTNSGKIVSSPFHASMISTIAWINARKSYLKP